MINYLLLKLVEFIYDEEIEMSWIYQQVITKENKESNERGVVYELSDYL